MLFNHGTLIKSKKIKDYTINMYILHNDLIQILVYNINKEILKSKAFVLGDEEKINKEILKSATKYFSTIKEVIYNKIQITQDDYDIILLDKINRK